MQLLLSKLSLEADNAQYAENNDREAAGNSRLSKIALQVANDPPSDGK
jgi:hypothetical protein